MAVTGNGIKGGGVCCDDCSSFRPSSSKARPCVCHIGNYKTDTSVSTYEFLVVNVTLSATTKKNHLAQREILTTAKYLTHQGLAFRSHDDITGNFDQLLNLRANDMLELQHFSKNKKNFASCKMQN
ncbi:hypothetical protein PR048_032399 [Dryococelus australis]|uniref:Uncharacterized protein n=1 Tax=Dryococelus australis TaxID=614101 RepID=A0ABQ9G240_9NEOP|nr:hypothetical protein PR048_032399 [Dryococelus australis]